MSAAESPLLLRLSPDVRAHHARSTRAGLGFFSPASFKTAISSSFEEAIAGISLAAEDRKPPPCGGKPVPDGC